MDWAHERDGDTATIYGLYDPRDESLRYVGVTTTTIEQRLARHISEAKRSLRTGNGISRKNDWVVGLLESGLKPQVREIDEAPYYERCSAEVGWIQHFSNTGCDLLNIRGKDPLSVFAGKTNEILAIEKDVFLKHIGDMVRQERLKQGVSLRRLAERCNISHSAVAWIEAGKDPLLGTVFEVAVALGINPFQSNTADTGGLQEATQ